MRQHIRFDGTTRDGESALLIVVSRSLQDLLSTDPEPFVRAVVGAMEGARGAHFRAGEMETIQTVLQVERGFRLSLPMAGASRVMEVLTTMYPSLTSRILVVNLPGYLTWFVNFIKGFLCELTANKIELINNMDALLDHYEPNQLPSYYQERGGVK